MVNCERFGNRGSEDRGMALATRLSSRGDKDIAVNVDCQTDALFVSHGGYSISCDPDAAFKVALGTFAATTIRPISYL